MDGSGSLKGLDKYEQGKEITYSVTEEGVEGYSTEINGYDIKNTYNSERRVFR